jgi:hypothetical protein
MAPGSPANMGISFLEGAKLVFFNQGKMSRTVTRNAVTKATPSVTGPASARLKYIHNNTNALDNYMNRTV